MLIVLLLFERICKLLLTAVLEDVVRTATRIFVTVKAVPFIVHFKHSLV